MRMPSPFIALYSPTALFWAPAPSTAASLCRTLARLAMHAPPNRVNSIQKKLVVCTLVQSHQGNWHSYGETQRWEDSPYNHGTTRAPLSRSYRRALSWTTRQPSYLPWVNATPERARRRRHESLIIAHWSWVNLVAADSGYPLQDRIDRSIRITLYFINIAKLHVHNAHIMHTVHTYV